MDPHSFDYANLANLKFIEELYHQYLKDPSSVDASWKFFFEGMQMASSVQNLMPEVSSSKAQPDVTSSKDLSTLKLIEAYRKYGHLAAKTNPVLKNTDVSEVNELKIESHGFSEQDLEKEVFVFGFYGQEKMKLQELVAKLQSVYCSSMGVESDHCDVELKEYVQALVESKDATLSVEEKTLIMKDLNHAEMFESFIHLKYPGQKRFSLEGGESTIPMVREVLDKSASHGVTEAIFAMAHRGRLNVLANIMKKPYSIMFHEFEPTYMPDLFGGAGDVKYHLGYVSKIKTTDGKEIQVTLSDNPSHLESVDPVMEGMAKASEELSKNGAKVLPILIHGDASVAGQGVVFETMQLSQVNGYSTNGTIHIVINNQVGFTATEKEARSTRYATDVAKTFGAPVFHVNGDDPESCVLAGRMAAEIRAKFGIDVFLEVLCYRKYGHNEGDEPAFTLPVLYQYIREKKNPREIYKEKVVSESVLTQSQVDQLENEFRELLEQELAKTKEIVKKEQKQTVRKDLSKSKVFEKVETKVGEEDLEKLAEAFTKLPEGFSVHRKVQRILSERVAAVKKKEGIDWGLAETLAYATLLVENKPVRLSGQDSERGTFAHRHAVIVHQETGEKYTPLQHLSENQGSFTVYNSPLSEYAVLGFEFGYAYINKEGLTIWEAQYGDFANGAQIIIDQYIASSETKWGLKCPLVMMLPHGAEGGGPEHSSARIERYLQLCSCYNMHVIIPTKPSQLFHALRRQALSDARIPLVIFMPKMLLRYQPSLSSLDEFSKGSFEEIFDDTNKEATRVLICCGKIYYELLEEREKLKADHIAIIRIEQLYPFNTDKMKQILSSYKKMKECYFVQEEHSNAGAYEYLTPYLNEILPSNLNLCYVGRARSASPAAGTSALYKQEREIILKQAFGKH